MLNSQHPMFIWWGADLVQFYNDAYRATMGPAMHPKTLGAKGRETWVDIWPIIGPQIECVLAGHGATWNVDQLVPINRTGIPENVWWTYGYSPIDLEGEVGGVLVVCNDVTAQHLQTEGLKDRTTRLELLFEQAPGFITTTRGPDHIFETANSSYRRLLGNRDLIGLSVRQAVPEVNGHDFINLLDEVYRTGEPFVGRRMPLDLQPDPAQPSVRSYLDFIYQAIKEPDGSISGIFVEGQDVTDHVQAEELQALINGELQHRVKNTLAIVQAIASQSLRTVENKQPVDTFLQRLKALSGAHDALVQQNWSSAEIQTAVEAIVSSFALGHRFEIAGPRLLLAPNATLSLSMMLHELTTNAVKYGSLSVEGGRVDLNWSIDDNTDNRILVFNWIERGGPPVTAPKTKGFGTKLVKMGLDGTGDVQTVYNVEGFSAMIRAPMDHLQRK